MSSYVYMKILESQPERYDRGISLISLGRSEKIKKKLVDDNVQPGFKILEIGCGTGTMALLAARKGATVTGFDVSGPMLEVARKKIESEKLSEKMELMEMGVSGMDKFPDAAFDLVMSTLVFSELSRDEQAYALRHAYRILKPGATLAVADESKPVKPLNRLLHAVVRAPMAFITFILTQTTTKAVDGLPRLIKEAGFKIHTENHGPLDGFIYITALKEA